MPQEVYDALDKVRDKYYEIINEHNISIDEILN